MSAKKMASWHRGIKALRVDAAPQSLAASRIIPASLHARLTPRCAPRGVRAFSLIEVLLAIFILGIGVISIAALFPAGIAQQRRSADDILGPIVANNAIELIRTKLRSEDFGTFEEYRSFFGSPVFSPLATIPGDWPWLRPGFIFEDDEDTDYVDERGMLDIFSYQDSIVGSGVTPPIPFDASLDRASEYATGYTDDDGNFVLWGIPYNTTRHNMSPAAGSNQTVPYFTITQQERYYPMQSQHVSASVRPEAPQYVWDCMFRRFGGRIYVAVFVYRVNITGGGGAARYVVSANQGNPTVPPLPISLNLITDPGPGGSSPPYYSDNIDGWDAWGLDGTLATADDAIVQGTVSSVPFDLQDPRQAWQQAGQWLLDQNLNIHRVLSAERPENDAGASVQVELVRAPPPVLGFNDLTIPPPGTPPTGTPTYYYNAFPGGGDVFANVVSNIWYIPATLDLDMDGDVDHLPDTPATLTPVFATVQEL